jgi:hypothetical protein
VTHLFPMAFEVAAPSLRLLMLILGYWYRDFMLVRGEILERWWQEGRRCCGWFLWLLRGGCPVAS